MQKKIFSVILGILVVVCVGLLLNGNVKERTFIDKVKSKQEEATTILDKKSLTGDKKKTVEIQSQSNTEQKVKIDYEGKNVQPLTLQDVKKVNVEKQVQNYGIGIIQISSLNIDLVLFEGISAENLAVGAGTMKENQQLGKGNFAIAGHHMANASALFGRLDQAKVGSDIEVTVGNQEAHYQVTAVKKITENEGYVQNDSEGEGIITLITCDSAQNTTNRIMVRGILKNKK